MKFDRIRELTRAHMDDPQPGDRFHEMFSFWVIVTGRDGDRVRTTEGSHGWKWEQKTYESVEAFKAAYAYGSIPGYSVMYAEPPDAKDNVPARDAGSVTIPHKSVSSASP